MNTPNRRSMTVALKTPELSAEALALIKQGTPEPLSAKPVSAAATPRKEEMPRLTRTETRPEKSIETPSVERSRQAAQKEPEPAPVIGLSHLSVRLPAELPQALLRASLDRKLKRIKPWTQQEIVMDALTLWLRKNNYLN